MKEVIFPVLDFDEGCFWISMHFEAAKTVINLGAFKETIDAV